MLYIQDRQVYNSLTLPWRALVDHYIKYFTYPFWKCKGIPLGTHIDVPGIIYFKASRRKVRSEAVDKDLDLS